MCGSWYKGSLLPKWVSMLDMLQKSERFDTYCISCTKVTVQKSLHNNAPSMAEIVVTLLQGTQIVLALAVDFEYWKNVAQMSVFIEPTVLYLFSVQINNYWIFFLPHLTLVLSHRAPPVMSRMHSWLAGDSSPQLSILIDLTWKWSLWWLLYYFSLGSLIFVICRVILSYLMFVVSSI